MVKKTFLLFFVFFVTYTIIVNYSTDTHGFISEHQWQDNQINAQKYLYSNTDTFENIIVGSSLSQRLNMNNLPRVYNLSMGGLSIFDGLQTIIKKGVYPKMVFVEMNILNRKPSVEFTTSLNNPIMTFLRKYFISIRDGKQPMGFISKPYGEKVTTYGINFVQRSVHFIARKIIPQKQEGTQKVNMFAKIRPRLVEKLSQVPVVADLEKDAQYLKYYVDILEKNGVTVVFFEMPRHRELCQLNTPVCIRKQFYKTFSRSKYQYIDMFDNEYVITDGSHLDKASAERYTLFFKEQIDKLNVCNVQKD